MRVNKLVLVIKDYILDDEDREELVSELKRYKSSFPSEPDYNYYRYGNILPYYSQIREFITNIGLKCDEDNERMCTSFCHAVGKAIDLILEEEK